MLGPKGSVGVNPKYLSLNQNLVSASNIYLTESDINVNVFLLPFLGATSSYGVVRARDNGLERNMFWFGLVFVHAKTEKN